MRNKIFVMLRTRDEERNMKRFCTRYPPENVDKILISDGYSTDRTIEIAKKFPHTYFRPFMQKVYGDNGIFRQPEGKHFNFVNRWAREEGADDETWLIWDDCDSYPTEALVKDFRFLFDEADRLGMLGVKAYHIYMWGKKEYFPKANIPGQFIYAWKAKLGLYWEEKEEWGVTTHNCPSLDDCYSLTKPYALMHDFTPTKKVTKAKYNFYLKSNRMTGVRPVYEMFGPSTSLEEWMK